MPNGKTDDEFAQYIKKPAAATPAAAPAAGDDEFAQYKATAPAAPPKAAAPPAFDPSAAFSKAQTIGPGAGKLDAFLGRMQAGMDAAGRGKGLAPQQTIEGNVGQLAGFLGRSAAIANVIPSVGTASDIATQPKMALPDDWQEMHELIRVKPSQIRIGGGASSLEEAATVPARGLAKEGFTPEVLKKMNPMERSGAIVPLWNKAGQAVDHAVIDATARNVTYNPTRKLFEVLANISNARLRTQAVNQLSDLIEMEGIRDPSKITPLEGLTLRRALQAGAKFGPNGQFNSLGGIRQGLYNAASDDLQSVTPGLQEADQHYSDMKGAKVASENAARLWASKSPLLAIENVVHNILAVLP